MGKTAPCEYGPHLLTEQVCFSTLIKGHHMIIYAILHSNLSISFGGEDFQRCNIHYHRKNGPAPIGASFTDVESWF